MSTRLRDRLIQYEVAPPPNVWEGVREALLQEEPALAARLSSFEITPPVNSWSAIKKSLEGEARAGNTRSAFRRFPRYAAAAAVLVLIFISARYILSRNDDPLPTVAKESTEPVQLPVKENPQITTAAPVKQEQETTAVEKNGTARTVPSLKKENKRLVATAPAVRMNPNRYLTKENEEGNTVRLSRKVAPLFNCAEDLASWNSIRCRENIQVMQEKMAQTLISPSSDFAGLVDLLRSLEEKR
jgi:hypothetical protein